MVNPTYCLSSITRDNASLLNQLLVSQTFSKEVFVNLAGVISKDNLSLAKKLYNDKDFPQEFLTSIISNTNPNNLTLAERLISKNSGISPENISKILRFASKPDNISTIEKYLDNPDMSIWLDKNLSNNFSVNELIGLERTQTRLLNESQVRSTKEKPAAPKKETPTVSAKPADIVKAEEKLVDLGVHPKQAPNYVKMCQENGIVDKLKLDAVCALASVGVPVKEIKNIFKIATGNPVSGKNGEFRPDVIKDIITLKQSGVEDLKLAANIAAVRNMSDIELKARLNTAIRQDLVNRMGELPPDVISRLKTEGIDLDEVKAKALQPPKQAKNIKPAEVQPVQLRSLDNIVGVERIILNKFKREVGPEIWQDPVRFRKWAEDKLQQVIDFDANPNYTCTGNYARFNEARRNGIESWYKFLKEESNYKDDPFVSLLVMDGITRDMRPNNANVPPAVSHESFEAAVTELSRANTTVAFSEIYAAQARLNAIKQYSKGVEVVDGVEGQWVSIPRSKSGTPNYDEHIAMVQALSEGSSWCLRFENAHNYLQSGNLHFFVDKYGYSQVAINETDGVITQIQKRYNQDSTVPVPYSRVVSNWAKKNNYKGYENEIQNALDAKPKFDALKAKITAMQSENRYLEIFKELGIDAAELPDGTLSISYYQSKINSKYTISELGINENKLLQNVSEVRGNVDLDGSNVTELPKLKVIGGRLTFGDKKLSGLTALESINGKPLFWLR